MKGIDIFCASQAATAIRPQNAAVLLGGAAAIDRHNPIIGDSRRPPKSPEKKNKNENVNPKNGTKSSGFPIKSWSCTRPGDFLSPPGSTRFLLREKLVDDDDSLSDQVKTEELCSSHSFVHQVVHLRVSLHCRGCERKLRKHLSRMEGVTSFDIDFTAKKVTVKGNVTPLGVLSSISKVKNAQLWSPAISSEFNQTTPKEMI